MFLPIPWPTPQLFCHHAGAQSGERDGLWVFGVSSSALPHFAVVAAILAAGAYMLSFFSDPRA
jgi:hypothetical protein